MWANCRLYNQDESDIVQLANDLARRLLAAWQDRGLPVAPNAAAPQPQPLSSPPAKLPLAAGQPAAKGGTQRIFRTGQQADPTAQDETMSNGRQAQPEAQPAPVNGHAQHAGPRAAARSSKRSKQPASVGASIANGEVHQGLSKSNAHDIAKTLSGPSPAPVSADTLQNGAQRPSLKITLRTASAVKSIIPAPQKQVPAQRKLTVKLRASSADTRNNQPL